RDLPSEPLAPRPPGAATSRTAAHPRAALPCTRRLRFAAGLTDGHATLASVSPAAVLHQACLARTDSQLSLSMRPSSRAIAEAIGRTASKAAALHARMPRSFARLPPP